MWKILIFQAASLLVPSFTFPRALLLLLFYIYSFYTEKEANRNEGLFFPPAERVYTICIIAGYPSF